VSGYVDEASGERETEIKTEEENLSLRKGDEKTNGNVVHSDESVRECRDNKKH
jgi:hypothetical protein